VNCKVSLPKTVEIEKIFHLTYTAISASGVGIGLSKTTDWKSFSLPVMMLAPHSKECSMFDSKIDDSSFRTEKTCLNMERYVFDIHTSDWDKQVIVNVGRVQCSISSSSITSWCARMGIPIFWPRWMKTSGHF